MRKKINLYVKTYTQNAIGDFVEEVTKRTVFCDVKSISGQEFANAGQNGIKPALVFLMWAHEYGGEDTVEYLSKDYVVYRTYVRDDGRVELYTEVRAGES